MIKLIILFVCIWILGAMSVTWTRVYKDTRAYVIAQTSYSMYAIYIVFGIMAFIFWIPFWIYVLYQFIRKERRDIVAEAYPLEEQTIDRLYMLGYRCPEDFTEEETEEYRRVVEDKIFTERAQNIEKTIDPNNPYTVTPFGRLEKKGKN